MSSKMIFNLEPGTFIGDRRLIPKKLAILTKNTFAVNIVNISDSIRKVGGVYLLLEKLDLANTSERFQRLLETLVRLLHLNSINLKVPNFINFSKKSNTRSKWKPSTGTSC